MSFLLILSSFLSLSYAQECSSLFQQSAQRQASEEILGHFSGPRIRYESGKEEVMLSFMARKKHLRTLLNKHPDLVGSDSDLILRVSEQLTTETGLELTVRQIIGDASLIVNLRRARSLPAIEVEGNVIRSNVFQKAQREREMIERISQYRDRKYMPQIIEAVRMGQIIFLVSHLQKFQLEDRIVYVEIVDALLDEANARVPTNKILQRFSK